MKISHSSLACHFTKTFYFCLFQYQYVAVQMYRKNDLALKNSLIHIKDFLIDLNTGGLNYAKFFWALKAIVIVNCSFIVVGVV